MRMFFEGIPRAPIDVEACYRVYGPMVLRRCRAVLSDKDEAFDAMQDVFVNLMKRKESIEERGLSSLLYTMATNVCLNRIRASKRRRETLNDELISAIASRGDIGNEISVKDELTRIFEREGTLSQTIAMMYFLDDMTHEDVAEAVGMSVSGVRKRLRKLEQTARASGEVP